MTTPDREGFPIQATPTSFGKMWSVRLPVRGEEVTLAKQAVVRERVIVTRKRQDELARVEAVLQREELRTETQGTSLSREREAQRQEEVVEDANDTRY
jgi:uncharacterized protein (TIGR02271 family)